MIYIAYFFFHSFSSIYAFAINLLGIIQKRCTKIKIHVCGKEEASRWERNNQLISCYNIEWSDTEMTHFWLHIFILVQRVTTWGALPSRSHYVVMVTSSQGELSKLLALCEGNLPVSGGLPSQRCGILVFSLLSAWKPLNKQSNCQWFERRWHTWDIIVMVPMMTNFDDNTAWCQIYCVIKPIRHQITMGSIMGLINHDKVSMEKVHQLC